MYTGLQHTHSYFAYLVLAGLIISILNAVLGYANKRLYTDRDKKIAMLGLVTTHIQFVVGLLLYFVSPLGFSHLSGDNMGDSVSRLYMLEHPLINLIAVVLITIGYSRAKRMKEDSKRFSSIYIFYGIGLVLLLSRIPWQAWLN